MFVDLQKGSHILIFIKNHSSWDEFAPGRIDFNRLAPEQGGFFLLQIWSYFNGTLRL